MGIGDFEVLSDQAMKEVQEAYRNMLTAKKELRTVFTRCLLEPNEFDWDTISEAIVKICKDVANEGNL